LHHESVQGHLPTGGWGHRWIGEPDAGYGEDQPGSWAYNILAYIEQESLRTLGSGIANLAVDPLNMDHQAALMQLVRTPVAVFNCPSKRPLDVWPYASDVFMAQNLFMCSRARNCFVMRGDYRVNGGSINAGGQTGPGLAQNPDIYDWALIGPNRQNGICTQRSRIRISQVSDGAAKTFMIGEKYLNTKRYFDGEDPSDDQCVYAGHDRDNVGYTAMSFDEIYLPLLDEPTNDKLAFRFGGPHRAGVNMALCDGSVHTFAYDIDELAWKYYGGRNDESPE
jgi:prepilin-type processing-associated H-X9-DG protein